MRKSYDDDTQIYITFEASPWCEIPVDKTTNLSIVDIQKTVSVLELGPRTYRPYYGFITSTTS